MVSKGLSVVMCRECLNMFSCCYPGFAYFLGFKHHSNFSSFRKTLGSNGCTNGTHTGKVLIQVSSRLRARCTSEENEPRS